VCANATTVTCVYFSSRIERVFRAEGARDEIFQPDQPVGSKESARKAHYAAVISNASRDWPPLLLQKVWDLIETSDEIVFL
jgi:hypothetical protein